jgi:hypothetical protein
VSVTYGSNKTYLMYLLVFYIWETCLEMPDTVAKSKFEKIFYFAVKLS